MSKGSDPKDSGERRRSRGGLRVPSDNVPRSASSESDVPAPVPEALGLAASVSESFGVAGNAAADESNFADSEHDEMQTIISEPEERNGRPDTEDDPNRAAPTSAKAPRAVEEHVLGDPAVHFQTRPAFAVDDASEVYDSIDTGEVVELPEADDYETYEEYEDDTAGADLSGVAQNVDDRITGESVDIPFDEGEDTAAGAAMARDEVFDVDTRVDATGGLLPLAAELPSPLTPAAPVVVAATGKGKKARFKRAMTMALSDADLEEVGGSEEPILATPQRNLQPSESGEVLRDDELEEIPEVANPKASCESSDPAISPPTEVPAPRPAEPPAPPPTPIAKAAPPKLAVSKPAPLSKPGPPAAPPKPAPAPHQAAASDKRKRRSKPWFEEIFDEDYLRTLPFLTPQATQFEANFVMESLGIESGAQILDVGCGYGRHAMELAARGYHVVGLDSSLPLLLRGADEAQRRGLTINFVHGDMREMTFESQFDGAYCLFSSFGYFDDETNKRTAQNIAKALKPGARFVVEVLNRDYLVADLPSRVWWEGDGCVVLEEVEFNYFSSRIVSNRSVVFDDGRQLEHEISLRSFSLHELGKFLHAVGFRVLEISGSMSTRGRFFGAHSRDIVVVAERRGGEGDNSQG